MAEAVRVVGRVKLWRQDQGYGFLSTGVGDVMVHRATLQTDGWGDRMPHGADVTADIVDIGGKWRARKVLAVTLI